MTESTVANSYQAYCENEYGWIFMRRDDFESQVSTGGDYFVLNLTPTPIVNVTASPQFLNAVAREVSSNLYEVEVRRYDPKDEPTSGQINMDLWHVAVGAPDITRLIEAANGIPSTEFDDELIQFNEDHVPFFKIDSSANPDHQSSALPPHVLVAIKNT